MKCNDIEKSLIKETVIDNIGFSEIRKSKIHGFGLFATRDIYEGTILGFLDGQIIAWDLYDKIYSNIYKHIKSVRNLIYMEWNAISRDTLLVRSLRTKYSFINHSREPNLLILKNPMRVVVTRKIISGEELLLDYREEPLREEYLDGYGNSFL